MLVFMCSALESSVVCEHACVWECTCVQRRPEEGHSSGSVNLIFRQGLFMAQSLLIRPDWLTSSQQNLLYVPPLLGLLSQATTPGYFMWVLGMLARKALYQLSPLPPPEDLSVILLCSYMYIIAIVFGSKTWFILAFAYEKLGELTGHACIRKKWQPSAWLGRWAQLGLLDATCKCNKCLLP